MDCPLQHFLGDRCLQLPLDSSFQRPSAIDGIIPHLGQMTFDLIGHLQGDPPFLKPLSQAIDLDFYDSFKLLIGESPEDHDFVHTVEKFRSKMVPKGVEDLLLHRLVGVFIAARIQDELATDIGGHDYHRVFEVHGSAVGIGEPPIVEDLKEHVEDIVVGLFRLIEEDYGKGFPPDSLGELTALLIADITRGCADESGHGMFFHVFGHVDPDHGLFIVKETFGKRSGQLRFADSRRPQEDEAPDGAVGVLDA